MSRNLYILAGTLFGFSILSFAMTLTTGPYQIGMPGNGSLWKMLGFVLLLGSLFSALAGVMRAMFEQVERRNFEREMRELERGIIERGRKRRP